MRKKILHINIILFYNVPKYIIVLILSISELLITIRTKASESILSRAYRNEIKRIRKNKKYIMYD